MIPIVYFDIGTKYTIISGTNVVCGTVAASSLGKLQLTNADVYDIAIDQKTHHTQIEIDYSTITAAGFCSDARYSARNRLCWQLNDLPAIN